MKNSKIYLALLAVCFLALGLRVWNADFGLPHQYVPDELNKWTMARELPANSFVTYKKQPSFLLYTYWATMKLASPFQSAGMERFPGWAGPDAERAYQLWIGRLLMAAMGVGTCLTTFLLGRKLWSQEVGLGAAALYAISPLAVGVSHYIKEDNAVAMFVPLALWGALRIAEAPTTKRLLVGGLLCGFAFGAKYPGGLTALIAMYALWLSLGTPLSRVALVLTETTPKAPIRRLAFPGGAALIFAGFLLGFAIFCPSHVIQALSFLRGVAEQTTYMATDHHDGVKVTAFAKFFTFYLRKAIGPGLGWLALVATILGVIALWKDRPVGAKLILAWTVGYWLLIELSPAKPYPFHARYAMPIIPCIAVLAMVGVMRFERRTIGRIGYVVLILSVPLTNTLRAQWKAMPDTRDAALAWIATNIPKGTPIMSEPCEYIPPYSTADHPMIELEVDDIRKWLKGDHPATAIAIATSFRYDRFLENPRAVKRRTNIYRTLIEKSEVLAKFEHPSGVAFGFHNPTLYIVRVQAEDLAKAVE